MSIETWIIITLVIFLSGIVKGTTGFGFALFSLPMLAHFVPIKSLIPLLTLFNLLSSVQIVTFSKGLKLNRRIILLSASGIIGVLIGTVVLKYIDETWLKMGCSVALIILSVLFLTGYRFPVRKLRRGCTMAGFVSGFLGGSTSVSGPPLALFLTSIKMDSQHFRYFFAWFSVITASVAFFDYIKIGIVSSLTFKLFAFTLPALILSLQVGKFLNNRVSVKLFYKVIVIITLLSGILLFGAGLKSHISGF